MARFGQCIQQNKSPYLPVIPGLITAVVYMPVAVVSREYYRQKACCQKLLSETLNAEDCYSPIKKPRRKVYRYQKGNYIKICRGKVCQ